MFKNFAHDQTLKSSELKALVRYVQRTQPGQVQMSTLPTLPDRDRTATASSRSSPTPDLIVLLAQLALSPRIPPDTPLPLPQQGDGAGRQRLRRQGRAAPRRSTAVHRGRFQIGGRRVRRRPQRLRHTQIRYAPGQVPPGLHGRARASGTLNLVPTRDSAKNTLDGDVLVIVGRDYDSLKHNFHYTATRDHDDDGRRHHADDSASTPHDARPRPRQSAAHGRHALRARRPEDRRTARRLPDEVKALSPRAFLHRLIALVVAVVLITVSRSAARTGTRRGRSPRSRP